MRYQVQSSTIFQRQKTLSYPMKKLILIIISFFAVFIHDSSKAAVILQYHHVSNDTPKSTSISPQQFAAHMQYLADNSYRVVPLSDVINSITEGKPIADKTVVITFDDAYLDILEQGKPILDRFNYPFTIFINPGIINRGSKQYLSWAQLKAMAEDDVIIANHGFEHDSWARQPNEMTESQWLRQQIRLLDKAEQELLEKTGQSWRYFAYPYGEFTPEIEKQLAKHNYVAFSQQSGAVGPSTSLTNVPRFPASQPYDKLSSLADKLKSLPLDIELSEQHAQTIYSFNELSATTFKVNTTDFRKSQLNCYISGLGKQTIHWLDDNRFSITFSAPLPIGRVRSNCTAPSISKPGRYYWYSKPWFILKEGKKWYPL